MKTRGEPPSRQEIIGWINDTLNIGLTAIEELGSGAVFCQLLLTAHPSAIPQHRINCNAATIYEFQANFRLLQRGFLQAGISRPIDVASLAKAQYRDNFQLSVWFYWYLHNSQQPQTDCTLSSQGLPQIDFSFARRTVSTKLFTPRREHHDGPCSCISCQERGEWKLRRRLRELEVKMEMMQEVILSGEPPEEMCFLIGEIVGLSAV